MALFRIEQTKNTFLFIPMIPVIIGISTYTEFFDYFTDSFSKFCMGMDHLKSSFDLFRYFKFFRFHFHSYPSKSGLAMNFVFLYLNALVIAAG